MGVNALFASAIAGIRRRVPQAEIVAFDTLLGDRRQAMSVDAGDPVDIRFLGFRTGRRLNRSENLRNMEICRRLGPIGRGLNPGVRALYDSDAVLDVSGGDSFTDMYPDQRITGIAGCKELVLRLGKPLVLLPQTYGPFNESRDRAISIVRGATACFARDNRSFETLKSLLGSEFDPDRHRCGVDMAFGLDAKSAMAKLPPRLADLVANDDVTRIGLNVSGLITNRRGVDKSHYGFKADYHSVMKGFVEAMLQETSVEIVLVPHVMSPIGSSESDLQACEWLRSCFDADCQGRITISPTSLDQCEVKWLISRLHWFCGTRMHATIAGLSTHVPTATVSYSDKAQGVFESCGQGGEVFDPRNGGTEEVVEKMKDSFARRDQILASLQDRIPAVKKAAEDQMSDLVSILSNIASSHASDVGSS